MYPFAEGSFAVRNGWYVAGWRHEITRDPMERWILGEPIALYRTEEGAAVALQGRCPHRHFPLGKSKVAGDDIVCGYHGISFNPEGKCTGVPSLGGRAPEGYRIKRYPLVERGLWAWIWPGDPEKADESLIPDLDQLGFEDPSMKFKPFYRHYVNGRYQLLNDNLLDLTHIAYLHGSNIGTLENASAREEREERPGFLRSQRWMRGIEQAPMMSNVDDVSDYKGRVDRLSAMDFYLPGFHAGIDDTFIYSEHSTRAGEQLVKARVFHAVTPALSNTCHYFFALGGTATEAQFDQLHEYLKNVISEDKFATEEIEKMLQGVGGSPKELLLRSDAHAIQARKMLQAMMDAERTSSV